MVHVLIRFFFLGRLWFIIVTLTFFFNNRKNITILIYPSRGKIQVFVLRVENIIRTSARKLHKNDTLTCIDLLLHKDTYNVLTKYFYRGKVILHREMTPQKGPPKLYVSVVSL